MNKSFYFVIALSFTLIGCNETVETEVKVETKAPEEQVVQVEETQEVTEDQMLRNDWERFKTAVLTKDEETISTYVLIDEFDPQSLIEVFEDSVFSKQLKESKFDDLIVDLNGSVVSYEFSMVYFLGDEIGESFECYYNLYFMKGENRLILEDFFAN